MEARVRILVVDDSAFMRKAICRMLAKDREIEVVGEARDGEEAVRRVAELRPDVATMDVEMPKMNGLEALRAIMSRCPTPIIMVSSLTREGARVTLEALDAGAVDFVAKSIEGGAAEIAKIQGELIAKIKAASGASVGRERSSVSVPLRAVAGGGRLEGSVRSASSSGALRSVKARPRIVVVGSSTGGPKAIQDLLTPLPSDLPVGIVVVQHMPPSFIPYFAERLDGLCRLRVVVAEDGMLIRPGTVLIAPGEVHCRVARLGSDLAVRLEAQPMDALHRPSVDELMLSAAKACPGEVLGIILTGMGADGTRGMLGVLKSGGATLGQDEATSVVYGMPRSAHEAGAVEEQVGIDRMADALMARLPSRG